LKIIYVEYVKLSDGTEGMITAIGLLETEIVGADFVPVRVPNTQIIGKKVSLYSKATKSHVHQVLRFKYSDLDKIPKLIVDIKDEIEARCSITNTNNDTNSSNTDTDDADISNIDDYNDDDTKNTKKTTYLDKPPSVTLVKYEADHIQVACLVEFDLKPSSTKFDILREQVLFAIADATKRNGVQFAIPAIQYEQMWIHNNDFVNDDAAGGEYDDNHDDDQYYNDHDHDQQSPLLS
jgi:small-conductance mechanosensitive channel